MFDFFPLSNISGAIFEIAIIKTLYKIKQIVFYCLTSKNKNNIYNIII